MKLVVRPGVLLAYTLSLTLVAAGCNGSGGDGTSRDRLLDMKFATLNTILRSGGGLFNLDQDDECRTKAIGDWLAQQDYDVIALQEMWDSRVHYLLQRALKGYRYQVTSKSLGGESGLAILSKHQLSDTWVYSCGTAPSGSDEWWGGVEKGLLGATLNLPDGRAIEVVTTHLQAAEYGVTRQRQVTELAATVVPRAYARGHAIVVLGDFNMDGIIYGDSNPDSARGISSIFHDVCRAAKPNACSEILDTYVDFTEHDEDGPVPGSPAWQQRANTLNCLDSDLLSCPVAYTSPKRYDYIWMISIENTKGFGTFNVEAASTLTLSKGETGSTCRPSYLSDHQLLAADAEAWLSFPD